MALDAERLSVIRMALDASRYERGAEQVERANDDMARSGVPVVQQQERQERAVYATERALRAYERAYAPAIAATRRYEQTLAQLANAEQRGLRSATELAAIRSGAEAAFLRATNGTAALTTATNAGALASGRFRMVVQQAGFQVGDFATQVASGGNALTAFVQQGAQLLGFFGAGGAIAGALLAIGGVAANMLLVGRNTEAATEATLSYNEAVRFAKELSGEAARTARELAKTKATEAIATQEVARATQQESAAKLQARIREIEAVRALGRFDAASEQDQTDTFTALGRNLERAQADLGKITGQIQEAEVRLAAARKNLEDVLSGRAFTDGGERGVAKLRDRIEELNKEADRAATTLVDRLLREGESEWERWTREVADANLALARLSETGKITAEQVERAQRALASRSPQARAMREAAAEQARQAERSAEEFARVWQRAADTATERAGDYFFDLFTGRASDIGQALRNSLLRAVADAAANFIVAPLIINPTVSAVQGITGSLIGSGGPLSGVGNFLGLGSSAYQAATGQSLLGGAGLSSFTAGGLFSSAAPAAGVIGPPAPGLLPFTAAQGLAAGGIGFGAGALIGALGGNRTVSSIGGAALGALGGFALGLGPAGIAIGALGGIAGGLFGGQKQGFAGGTSVLGIDPATGQLTVLGDTGKRYDAGSIANAVRPEVQRVNQLLASGGIRISSAGLGFNPLSSTNPFAGYGPGQGDGAQYGGTVESVLLNLLGQGRLRSDNPTINRVLGSGGVTGLASLQEGIGFATLFDQLKAGTDVTTQLEKAMKALREQLAEAEKQAVKYGFAQGEVTKATRQAFDRDVKREILGITDPLKLALEDFDRAAKERLAVARTLGADLVQVERLTQLQRKQIIEANAPTAATARSLSGLVDDVVFGGLSSGTGSQRFFSSVQRLRQTQRDALADPADAEARAAFESAARAALPIARDFLGTSERYGALEREVLSVARRLDPAADPANIAAQKIVDATATQTALLLGEHRIGNAELRAMRDELRRLARTVEALARKAA